MNFAQLFGFLYVTFGKTVIDRDIKISSVEGPLADYINGAIGKITAFDDSGVKIDLEKSINLESQVYKKLLLVPRHKNYEVNALFMTMISVYVFALDADTNDPHSCLAQADIKLVK